VGVFFCFFPSFVSWAVFFSVPQPGRGLGSNIVPDKREGGHTKNLPFTPFCFPPGSWGPRSPPPQRPGGVGGAVVGSDLGGSDSCPRSSKRRDQSKITEFYIFRTRSFDCLVARTRGPIVSSGNKMRVCGGGPWLGLGRAKTCTKQGGCWVLMGGVGAPKVLHEGESGGRFPA